MSEIPKICPRCNSVNYAKGRCGDCGFDRVKLWWGFWVCGLGAVPLAALAAWVFSQKDDGALLAVQACLGILSLGAFFSAFCASGLITRSIGRRILLTIAIAIGVFAFYCAVAFAGCLALLAKNAAGH
jgi:hypothetical protein